MPLFGQPRVDRLPATLSFPGKVALVTGANAGLGLATSLHLLQRGVSFLIMGVRNCTSGETVKSQLLADPIVASLATRPAIVIYELDLASEKSVVQFAHAIKRGIPKLDLAVYNAGMFPFSWKLAPETQREMTFQVNYLSTALLSLLLLPLIQSSSTPESPSHVIFVGSERAVNTSIPVLSSSVFDTVSSKANFEGSTQYARSKLLLALFVNKLARHIDSSAVVINNVCPGAVRTDLARDAPWIVQTVLKPLFFAVKGARMPEVGARLIIRAACGDDKTHGQLLVNERTTSVQFTQRAEGKTIQEQLWKETMEVMDQVAPGLRTVREEDSQ